MGVKVRKMTHGEGGPLICHRFHKGQGLGGGRANVINPTLLETANGRALVSGHEPPAASECMITAALAYLKGRFKSYVRKCVDVDHECTLLVKCEL